MKRNLKQVAEMAGGTLVGTEQEEMMISGVSKDSRTTLPHQLFVPLDIGYRFDGHDFVNEAFAKGAIASLWQLDHPNPPEDRPLILVKDTLKALQRLAREYRRQLSAKVIGVTGSNGKTTTKDMIASILSVKGKTHKTEGNLNNHVGVPMTILEADEDVEWLVLEMGMSGRGEIAALAHISEPDVAVITNVGEAHLLQLGSRVEIAKAKLEIVSGLKPSGTLIYPGEERLLKRLLAMPLDLFVDACGYTFPPTMKCITFGMDISNDFYPVAISSNSVKGGSEFELSGSKKNIFLPLLGKYNVLNATAAAACVKQFGVTDEMVMEGLAQLKISSMRADVIKLDSGATVLNHTYNANPASVRASLELLADMVCAGRKIAVLADMLELGKDEIKLHEELGKELDPALVEEVYTYGRLAQYVAEAARKHYPPGSIHIFADKAELIHKLNDSISKDDIILVKGSRGMKMEEVIRGLLQDKGD